MNGSHKRSSPPFLQSGHLLTEEHFSAIEVVIKSFISKELYNWQMIKQPYDQQNKL